jgi:hypothetical protein
MGVPMVRIVFTFSLLRVEKSLLASDGVFPVAISLYLPCIKIVLLKIN